MFQNIEIQELPLILQLIAGRQALLQEVAATTSFNEQNNDSTQSTNQQSILKGGVELCFGELEFDTEAFIFMKQRG